MGYYEKLYESVSQHLWGLHQKEGASFLSMSQELGLAKETVRKIARRDYKPGGGPNVQSLCLIQRHYCLDSVGTGENMSGDAVRDLWILAQSFPYLEEEERKQVMALVLRFCEKKTLRGEPVKTLPPQQ